VAPVLLPCGHRRLDHQRLRRRGYRRVNRRRVFTGVVAERRKERTIENLDGHCIICGHGRMGLDRVKGPDGVIEPGEVKVGAGTNEEPRRLEELADAG